MIKVYRWAQRFVTQAVHGKEWPVISAAVVAGYDSFTAGAAPRDVALVVIGFLVRTQVAPAKP